MLRSEGGSLSVLTSCPQGSVLTTLSPGLPQILYLAVKLVEHLVEYRFEPGPAVMGEVPGE